MRPGGTGKQTLIRSDAWEARITFMIPNFCGRAE